jgi:hypothetical protein
MHMREHYCVPFFKKTLSIILMKKLEIPFINGGNYGSGKISTYRT